MEMTVVNNSITTLAQAAQYLIHAGAVDMNTMQVEGKQLLDVCGYSYIDSQGKNKSKFVIERQIKKHSLIKDKDYTVHNDVHQGFSIGYQFTLNAANHILLAAMTDKGKAARQDAIDMRVAQQSIISLPNFANPAEAARAWANEFEQKQIVEQRLVEAVRTKAYISDKKTATAMATASVLSRKVKKLESQINQKNEHISLLASGLADSAFCPKRGKLTKTYVILKQISKEIGVKVVDLPDPRYGKVNGYHVDAIAKFKSTYLCK